jgi:hypothetical protein
MSKEMYEGPIRIIFHEGINPSQFVPEDNTLTNGQVVKIKHGTVQQKRTCMIFSIGGNVFEIEHGNIEEIVGENGVQL